MVRRHLTPAILVFLGVLCCCLIGPVFSLSLEVSLGAAAVCAATAIPLLGLDRKRARRAGLLLFSAAAGLFLGAASVARMESWRAGSYLPVPASAVTEIRGVAVEDSTLSRKGATILKLRLVAVSAAQHGLAAGARGRVLVVIGADDRFAIGERVAVRAPIAALTGTGPERFVAACGPASIRRLGFTSAVWAARAECRGWLHRTVANAGYPSAALLEALLIGSREDVPDSLYGSFQRTGSLHILALSGLHVTVIYGIVAGLLGFIRSRGARFAIATAVILFYQLLAGFMPSLLRATVMIIVAGAALLADRDREPLNALALSGLVILLIDPFQAASLSFQLSFLALLGILAVSPLIERAGAGFVPRAVLAPIAMAAGAQVATLPVVLLGFGAYYPSGLIAGLLLVPLTTVFLWMGLAWLVVSVVPFPVLHGAFAQAFDALYRVIDGCARAFGRLPGIVTDPATAQWVARAAVVLLVILCTAAPVRRRRREVAA